MTSAIKLTNMKLRQAWKWETQPERGGKPCFVAASFQKWNEVMAMNLSARDQAELLSPL